MNKRLENILTERLESIFHNGSCFVSWSELYYWYGTQRITKKDYADLETRFQEIDDNIKRGDKSGGKIKLMCITTTASGITLGGMILFAERTSEYVTAASDSVE